jgi:hypothetical protein
VLRRRSGEKSFDPGELYCKGVSNHREQWKEEVKSVGEDGIRG